MTIGFILLLWLALGLEYPALIIWPLMLLVPCAFAAGLLYLLIS